MVGTIHLEDYVVRVIDGDTAEISIALGLKTHRTENCRLFGINTPELNSTDLEQRAKAFAAKDYLVSVIAGQTVFCNLHGQDKYGRPLVTVMLSNGFVNINKTILDLGLGTKMSLERQMNRRFVVIPDRLEVELREQCNDQYVSLYGHLNQKYGLFFSKSVSGRK